MAFSPDQRKLAAASDDKTVTLYDLQDFAEIRTHALERSCLITRGGLTKDQWARFVTGPDYQDTFAS